MINVFLSVRYTVLALFFVNLNVEGYKVNVLKKRVMKDEENTGTGEEMSTLSSCMTSVLKKGYIDNFKVTEKGLYAPSKDKYYSPWKVSIDNFYRFEGASNPDDNAVLYALRTHDGVKGMLVDAYGAYSDELLNSFIQDVREIYKDEAEA